MASYGRDSLPFQPGAVGTTYGEDSGPSAHAGNVPQGIRLRTRARMAEGRLDCGCNGGPSPPLSLFGQRFLLTLAVSTRDFGHRDRALFLQWSGRDEDHTQEGAAGESCPVEKVKRCVRLLNQTSRWSG
jgi:hypothetical protein